MMEDLVKPTCEGVWVVIAAFNEGRRLDQTLSSLESVRGSIVVVDDGSTDHSSEIAARHPVWLIRHMINLGQGAALQTGIDFALSQGARAIVTFDADGQHVAADIEQLVRPVLAGEADVALGSRFLGQCEGIPASRWLVLKLGVLFTRLVSRVRVTDAHNGLRAFSRRAAEKLRITENRMAHASEILEQVRKHQLSYCEVPVTIHYDSESLAKGQSSWNSMRIATQLLLGKMVQ